MGFDEASLKFLLEQNLSTIKTFIQMMFSNADKKIDDLRAENEELKRSLQFTQNEMKDLKSQLNNSTPGPMVENSGVSERVRLLEDAARAENIRITGVPETQNEKSEQTLEAAQKIITDKLGLSDVSLFTAFRAGKQFQDSTTPRPIAAKLSSIDQKIRCFKNSKKLKGSNVYVSEDVCKATLDIRATKMDELKRKRREGFVAYFSGTEIICRRKRNVSETNLASAETNSENAPTRRSERNRNVRT